MKADRNVAEARCSIAAYFEFYNHQHFRQALRHRAPSQFFEEAQRVAKLGAGEKPLVPSRELAAQSKGIKPRRRIRTFKISRSLSAGARASRRVITAQQFNFSDTFHVGTFGRASLTFFSLNLDR